MDKNVTTEISNVMKEDVITAILSTMKVEIDNHASELIEKKVEEYREELMRNKNQMVADMLSAIEITVQHDFLMGQMQFNIVMRPKIYMKVEERK